jgi:hypothetical protein
MAKEAQTGPIQRASGLCGAHHGPPNEDVNPGARRSNDKAADRRTRGLIAMLLGWYRNAYSLAGVTLFLTLVPHGHLLSWPPLWNFRAAAEAE